MVEKFGEQYLFSYKGSSSSPYTIIVDVGNKIKTSCNCPYDYGGLCKHEVSALNYVLEQEKTTSAQNNKKKKTNSVTKNNNEIFLPNHIILDEEFSRNEQKNLPWTKIVKLDIKNRLVKTYSLIDGVYQTFRYNADKKILTTQCQCQYNKKM